MAKKKGGFLKALGIQGDKAPTKEDEKTQKRHDTIVKAWNWLRDMIDKACQEYQTDQNSASLRKCVERPVVDAMIQQLDMYSQNNVKWEQPDRRAITERRVSVVDEKLNSSNQPTEFTVRERFKDFSVLTHTGGPDEQRCPGKERVIQATVSVINGSQYKLTSVIEVEGAVLGDQ